MSAADDQVLRGRILATLEHLEKDMQEVKAGMDKNFVTQNEFWPVKTIVYTGAGITMISVLGVIIKMAVH